VTRICAQDRAALKRILTEPMYTRLERYCRTKNLDEKQVLQTIVFLYIRRAEFEGRVLWDSGKTRCSKK
jgi:hypothetical protein